MENKNKMTRWLMSGDYLNKKDGYYTPKILVEPILEFLKPNSYIWCPFDTKDSEFVKMLKEHGHRVEFSHIWLGQDFFDYLPPEFEKVDYVISNPPFSKKLNVFDRLFSLGKPFAMVCGLPILNYQEVGEFFLEKQEQGKNLQLLIVDKKVSFDGNTASFNNSYFCWNVLPKDIIFYHLENNNANNNYIPSSMTNISSGKCEKFELFK